MCQLMVFDPSHFSLQTVKYEGALAPNVVLWQSQARDRQRVVLDPQPFADAAPFFAPHLSPLFLCSPSASLLPGGPSQRCAASGPFPPAPQPRAWPSWHTAGAHRADSTLSRARVRHPHRDLARRPLPVHSRGTHGRGGESTALLCSLCLASLWGLWPLCQRRSPRTPHPHGPHSHAGPRQLPQILGTNTPHSRRLLQGWRTGGPPGSCFLH